MTTRAITFTIAMAGGLGLIGCQGALNDPLGPDPAGIVAAKGGKGGTSGTMLVTEGGAIVTAAPATFDVWTDGWAKLGGGTSAAVAAFAFSASRNAALADPASCTVLGNRRQPVAPELVTRAIGKLVSPEMSRALSLAVDLTALGAVSTEHHLGGTWQDGDGLFDIGVGTSQKAGAPVTAVLLSGDLGAGTSQLRYSGGTVSVKDRTGSASFSVICPNLDAVDVTITR